MTDAANASLNAIVAEATASHLDDISAAVDAALAECRRTSWFKDLTDELVREAILHQVHDCRHHLATTARRNAGVYGCTAKVHAGRAETIVADLFDYPINGRTLGSILGSELPEIAAGESERAKGHLFNARICGQLAALVPADKAVRECVSAKKLKAIFQSAE